MGVPLRVLFPLSLPGLSSENLSAGWAVLACPQKKVRLHRCVCVRTPISRVYCSSGTLCFCTPSTGSCCHRVLYSTVHGWHGERNAHLRGWPRGGGWSSEGATEPIDVCWTQGRSGRSSETRRKPFDISNDLVIAVLVTAGSDTEAGEHRLHSPTFGHGIDGIARCIAVGQLL